jgi:phage replication O-like protein O
MTAFLTPGDEVTADFSGEEARVFLHLFWTLGWNNEWNLLNQRVIAERTKMHPPQVSRVLASLTKRQVIIKGARVGSSHAYRLNPEIAWRGRREDYAAVRDVTPDVIRVAA